MTHGVAEETVVVDVAVTTLVVVIVRLVVAIAFVEIVDIAVRVLLRCLSAWVCMSSCEI